MRSILSKTCTKFSKTGPKLSKTLVKRVLNSVKRPCKRVPASITVYNQSQDPKTGCVLIPLGSPTGGRKRSYVHAIGVWCTVAACGYGGVRGRVWGPGGYQGGLYRVGTGRAIPGTTQPAARGAQPAKRAPEAPARGWSGWVGRALPGTAAGTVYPHPSGPVGLPEALPGIYLWNAASWPIGRDSTSFL